MPWATRAAWPAANAADRAAATAQVGTAILVAQGVVPAIPIISLAFL